MPDEEGAQGTGTGDTGTPGFVDTLPEDLRAHDALKGFTDVGGLAKAYAETVGKVPIVPESPDKYVVEGFDAKAVKEFAEVAHKAGMTNAQAAEALKYVQGRDAAREAAQTAEREAGLQALQKEWPGEAWKTNTALAMRAVERFATPEEKQFFDKTGLGDRPELIRMFYRIGMAISEDTLLTGKTKVPEGSGVKRNEFGQPTLTFPSMTQ